MPEVLVFSIRPHAVSHTGTMGQFSAQGWGQRGPWKPQAELGRAAQPVLEWPPGGAGPGVRAAHYLGLWAAAAPPALSVLALKWPLWEEAFMI